VAKLERIFKSLDVGPPVRVTISALPGRRTTRQAVAVFAPLDVASNLGYETALLVDILKDRADWWLGCEKLLEIENLNLAGEIARFGSFGRWKRESPAAGRILASTVPVYIAESRPSYEELETLQQAVHLIITNGEDRNPYELTTHAKDCTATIWDDQANDVLAPVKSLGRCSACVSQRGLWDTVIKRFGSSDAGRKAQRALELAAHLKQFRPPASRVSVRNHEYAEIAASEIRKRKRYHDWKAGQDAKNR